MDMRQNGYGTRHEALGVTTAANDTDIGALSLGESRVMQQVQRLIDKVSPMATTVLVVGESGAGKEVVAHKIHAASTRQSGPFVAINCAAIPTGLAEAELFGHEKGSFTGAVRSHTGVFERAAGGTLFLDEITEMSMDLQTRLLRVLESRRFVRVGGTTELTADVRLIAATNRDPMAAIRDGALREDLFYRLAVFPIALPPLRERDGDVMLLAERFLADLNRQAGTHKRLSPGAELALRRHSWPGNVRELRNVIERAFILADQVLEIGGFLSTSSAVAIAPGTAGSAGHLAVQVGSRLADMERSMIEATLAHFSGNKRQTAQALGCSLKTLYNKLNAYARTADYAAS